MYRHWESCSLITASRNYHNTNNRKQKLKTPWLILNHVRQLLISSLRSSVLSVGKQNPAGFNATCSYTRTALPPQLSWLSSEEGVWVFWKVFTCFMILPSLNYLLISSLIPRPIPRTLAAGNCERRGQSFQRTFIDGVKNTATSSLSILNNGPFPLLFWLLFVSCWHCMID